MSKHKSKSIGQKLLLAPLDGGRVLDYGVVISETIRPDFIVNQTMDLEKELWWVVVFNPEKTREGVWVVGYQNYEDCCKMFKHMSAQGGRTFSEIKEYTAKITEIHKALKRN